MTFSIDPQEVHLNHVIMYNEVIYMCDMFIRVYYKILKKCHQKWQGNPQTQL